MAVGSVSLLHSVVWGGSTAITQLEDLSPNMGVNMLVARSAGVYHPMFAAVQAHDAMVTFSTPQLSDVFDIFDAADTCFVATTNDTDLHYKLQSTSTGIATTTGQRLRVGDAAMVLNSISAGHQQLATANCTIYPVYDGTNAPIISSSQSVVGTAQAAQNYGLGPITINGTAIDGVIDCTVNLNPNVFRKGDASEPWIRHCSLLTSNPVVTIRSHSKDLLATYGPLTPTALPGALIVYYRAKTNSGTNAADGSSNHAKITVATGVTVATASSGGNNTPPVVTLNVYATKTTGGSVLTYGKTTTIV